MNQLLEEFSKLANITTKLTILQAFLAIFLTFVLTIIITQVYKKTYKGNNYSQSFVHTIIIMGVVVSVIMIVIGNNVAVAFGLVGAFSIIRFRSAMSDPKDIAFIFFGMATGIACGLGFYLLAILFTVSLSILIYILYLFNYARKGEATKRLRITVPENLHYENLFDDLFEKYMESVFLQKVETTNLGTMIQLEYLINNKTGISDKTIIDEIRHRNANLKVSMNYVNYEGR